MARKIIPQLCVAPAMVPTAGGVGAQTATVVDGTGGFDRVLWILATGAAATGATLSFKIQSCATSGGSYADVSSAAFTNLAAATGASKICALDMAIDPAKPFMKIASTVGTDTFANGAVAVLYQTSGTYPIASTWALQAVTL